MSREFFEDYLCQNETAVKAILWFHPDAAIVEHPQGGWVVTVRHPIH
jgi:hypothetical protein